MLDEVGAPARSGPSRGQRLGRGRLRTHQGRRAPVILRPLPDRLTRPPTMTVNRTLGRARQCGKKPNECQDSLESVPCGVDTGRDNHTQPQTVIEELKQRVTDANKRESDEPCPIRVLAEATIKLGPTTTHDRYLRELIPSFHILRRGIRRYSWNRRLHLLVEVIASPHVGSNPSFVWANSEKGFYPEGS